jgi:hypothetical protein
MQASQLVESYKFWDVVTQWARESLQSEEIVARALARGVIMDGLRVNSTDPRWMKTDRSLTGSPYVGYTAVPGAAPLVLRIEALEQAHQMNIRDKACVPAVVVALGFELKARPRKQRPQTARRDVMEVNQRRLRPDPCGSLLLIASRCTVGHGQNQNPVRQQALPHIAQQCSGINRVFKHVVTGNDAIRLQVRLARLSIGSGLRALFVNGVTRLSCIPAEPRRQREVSRTSAIVEQWALFQGSHARVLQDPM